MPSKTANSLYSVMLIFRMRKLGYKYQPEAFIALLSEAGFAHTEWWTDTQQRHFGVFYASP